MVTCTICNKKMKFVEGDVIHDDNWYHRACLKIKNKDIANICVQSKPLKENRKYHVINHKQHI